MDLLSLSRRGCPKLVIGLFLSVSTTGWASDIVRCNPSDPLVSNRVIDYQRSVSTQPAWLSDPTYVVNPDLSQVPGLSPRYWKCSSGQVVAMTLTEKTTLDAPLVAEQARQQTFTDEIANDNLCTAELSDLDARIDTVMATITDLASAKTVLAAALKKIARCVRARAR